MEKSNVIGFTGREETADPLTELLRQGAREWIQQAVEAELAEFMTSFANRRLHDGRSAVVRNGYLPERSIQTGIGPVTVQVPKVRAKDGQPVAFRSALVPPYVRKTRSLEAALPWPYLKGISTGEMESALATLIGPEAKGLSASTVARLKQQWGEEYQAWRKSRLDKDRWVYLWVDGIYSGLRAENTKLCALVVIGVNERGDKRFLAIEDATLRTALEEFARYNVGYHIWPYWREYVQNTCARMGVPPIPIPMYRLKSTDKREALEGE